MDYIEKLNLQTEEIKEVETLENHNIINNEPFSVNKYNGHTRDFLALDGDFNDGFKQLKEVKEARLDVNGNSHTKLKDRIDSEITKF